MRVRAVAAIVLLLLPSLLHAQRRMPVIGRRRPEQPVPLSPQRAPIARAVAYQRLRVSAECYPQISVVQAPSFATDGRASSWTAFGMGARVEYRLTPHASATMDLTSSVAGSLLIACGHLARPSASSRGEVQSPRETIESSGSESGSSRRGARHLRCRDQ